MTTRQRQNTKPIRLKGHNRPRPPGFWVANEDLVDHINDHLSDPINVRRLRYDLHVSKALHPDKSVGNYNAFSQETINRYIRYLQMGTEDLPEFVTRKQAMDKFGISRSQWYYWVTRKKTIKPAARKANSPLYSIDEVAFLWRNLMNRRRRTA